MVSFGAKQWLRWLGEDGEYPRAQGAQRLECPMTIHADRGSSMLTADCLGAVAA
jgi:hypothetical protein